MQFKKSVQAVVAALAMVAGSMTVMPTTGASAAGANSLFTMNLATSSSNSDSKNFVTHNGVTYFSAHTLEDGVAVYGVADTAGAKPYLVADTSTDDHVGWISHVTPLDHYLFFWDDNTKAYDGYRPFVVDLNTKVLTELLGPDGTKLSSDQTSGFALVGNKVYFAADDNRSFNLNWLTWTLGSTDGKTAIEDPMGFTPPYESQTISVGTNVFINQPSSNWNSYDARIKMWDTVAKTWSDVATADSTLIVASDTYGKFTYKGAAGIIVGGGDWSHPYKYYFIDGTGVATQINTTGTQSWGFYNVGSALYVRPATGWGAPSQKISLISETDGSWIDKSSVMFPNGSFSISSAIGLDGNLVFAAQVNGETHETLWKWDTTNAATRLGTVTSTKGRFADFVASGSWGRVEAIGVVGNKAVMNMYLDDAYGYEPYLIGLDGSVTLLQDMNKGSEGAEFDTECTTHVNNADYIVGGIPAQETDWGKSVIVEAKSDGTNILYSVIDAGVRNVCGIVGDGTNLYFTAYGQTDGDGLYKMAADRTITRMGSVSDTADGAALVGNLYYYWTTYDGDLYSVDITTGVETQLTGQGSSIVSDGYINNNAVLVGTKLHFISESIDDGNEYVFVVDLAAATYSETKVIVDPTATNDNPDYLVLIDGAAYFKDEPDYTKGPNIYKVNADGTSTLVLDVDPENDGWINDPVVIGTDMYFPYTVDGANSPKLIKLAKDGTRTEVSVPVEQNANQGGADTRIDCVGNIAGQLIAALDNGSAYFVGGATPVKSTLPFENNAYNLCYGFNTEFGTYLAMKEYSFDNGPWDQELGYFGALPPKAISRLGVPVTEAPSTPKGEVPGGGPAAPGAPGVPTVTAGNGKVTLSWTAATGTVDSYTVTSTPAGATCVVTGTTAVCSGLTNGTSYTFKVTATNAGGSTDSTVSATVKPVAPNPDDVNVTSTDETKSLLGTSGSITFPSGSGIDVDKKGKVFLKIASQYFLTRTSGKIVFTYKVGSATKSTTCVVKEFGSTKKLSKVPTKRVTQKDPKGCQMPSAALTAMKTGAVTIKATLTVKRYAITTGKNKTSSGATIKPMIRKLSATMGKKLG